MAEFKTIKTNDLNFLEKQHKIMLLLGWEQITEPKANFWDTRVVVKYKRTGKT